MAVGPVSPSRCGPVPGATGAPQPSRLGARKPAGRVPAVGVYMEQSRGALWKGLMSMDVYAWADRLIDSSPRYATGFTELLATRPYPVSPVVRRLYESRLRLIRSFQQIALEIFRAALNGEMHPVVLHWLMNETPDCVGLCYHRNLEDRHFTLPVFFRTDEVKPGRIIEIQCPGSAWGELQVAFEYAVEMGYLGSEESPADRFAAQLTDFLRDTPVVHHLLDNASAPPGMRYFIEKTRPGVRYSEH